MTYRYLLMDADGTLFDFDTAEKTSLYETVAFVGYTPTEEIFAAYHAANKALWAALERQEVTIPQLQQRRFITLLDVLHDPREGEARLALADAMNEYYSSRLAANGILYPGARELCARLSARYTLCLATNGAARTQRGRFAASGLAEYFAGGLFISQEMGVFKPDTAYYTAVMDTLGDHDPTHYLMVGDSMTSDMAGGHNAGIDTCYYCPDGGKQPAICTYMVQNYTQLLALLNA